MAIDTYAPLLIKNGMRMSYRFFGAPPRHAIAFINNIQGGEAHQRRQDRHLEGAPRDSSAAQGQIHPNRDHWGIGGNRQMSRASLLRQQILASTFSVEGAFV